MALHSANDVRFFRDLGDVNKKCPVVLSIGLACGSPRDMEMFFQIQNSLANNLEQALNWCNPHKTYDVIPASISKHALARCIKEADIIYAHGGDGDQLQEYLGQVDNLSELVAKNKRIGGGSAGTNCWVTNYYSNDNQAVCDGLGVLPIKTFCHYNGRKWEKLTALAKHGKELPLIPLGDEEYITITI